MQTFVRMAGEGADALEVELVPGGSSIHVTEATKHEWLRALLHSELVGSLTTAAGHFRRGLLDSVWWPLMAL